MPKIYLQKVEIFDVFIFKKQTLCIVYTPSHDIQILGMKAEILNEINPNRLVNNLVGWSVNNNKIYIGISEKNYFAVLILIKC